jgi:hypothetical protein
MMRLGIGGMLVVMRLVAVAGVLVGLGGATLPSSSRMSSSVSVISRFTGGQ